MRLDTPVLLHPLRFLVDGDEVVVGRTDIDSYALFPPDGAALIERLGAGASPSEAADWYRREFGEPVDLDDFLSTLDDLDFIAHGPAQAGAAPDPGPLPLQRLGRAVFSAPAWIGYGVLLVAAGLAMVADPGLRPRIDHVFFSEYLLVIELTLVLGQIPLIMLHEFCHLLAARRSGVRSRIRMANRLYFVVFETVMDGLVLVPRSQRHLPILAGMLADLLVVAVLTLAASITGGAVAGVCLGLAFTTLVRFATEFVLFLRTDVYFLVATASGCVDLHGCARELVRERARRLLGLAPRHDPRRWHPRDVRAARWYAPLYVLGYGAAFALLAVVVVPITWRFFATAFSALTGGHGDASHVLDAAGLLALNLAEPVVAGLLKLRDRHQERARRRARATDQS